MAIDIRRVAARRIFFRVMQPLSKPKRAAVRRQSGGFPRRVFIQAVVTGAAGVIAGTHAVASDEDPEAQKGTGIPRPTNFQIACMTLPYAQFPLERAFSGIKSAGYQYVAWGTTHPD